MYFITDTFHKSWYNHKFRDFFFIIHEDIPSLHKILQRIYIIYNNSNISLFYIISDFILYNIFLHNFRNKNHNVDIQCISNNIKEDIFYFILIYILYLNVIGNFYYFFFLAHKKYKIHIKILK